MAKFLPLTGLVCGVVGLLLYINTLGCDFCFDDKVAILQNKDLLPTSPWTNILWNDFWGHPIHLNISHKSYRPLCVATFRLNYMLHGLDPMGYHLVNVLLHAVVCYLYVQLCGVIFIEVWPALIAGLFFAVHPIHTEAVAGIVGRADLMSAIFYLLCLLCYHHHLKKEAEHDRRKHEKMFLFCLSMTCASCAMVCKEHGITALGVCLAYDLCIHQQNHVRLLFSGIKNKFLSRLFLKRVIMVVGFGTTLMILRIKLMKSSPNFSKLDNEGLSLETPYRQMHWAYLISVNAWLLLNPSHLLHDYRMNAIPLITSLWDLRNISTILTFIFLLSLGIIALKQDSSIATADFGNSQKTREKRKRTADNSGYNMVSKKSTNSVLIGMILLVIPFLPATNLLFPVGFVVAERILYLPSMGLCLIVAHSVHSLAKSKHCFISVSIKAALVFLIITHSVKTVTRNRDWQSRLSLYSSLLKFYPTNGHILANIAREFRNIEDYDRAELAYRHSMVVAPDLSISFVNLGSMLKKLQRYQDSEEVLLKAIPVVLKENKTDVKENVARLYTSICNTIARNDSRLVEATEYCTKAVRTNQKLSAAHNSLGAVLLQRGNTERAIQEFKTAAALNHSNTNPDYNLAMIYMSLGEETQAMYSLERVLAIDKNHLPAKKQLEQLRKK